MRWTADRPPHEALPSGLDVGSCVHGYGGGPYLVVDGTLFFANAEDRRVYRRTADSSPRPITAADGAGSSACYGDFRWVPGNRRVICVRELADAGVDQLVALDVEGSGEQVLVEYEFLSSPRLSPDRRILAWLRWRRPQMPWDGTELCVAELLVDGRLGSVRVVAGSSSESIFQPEWAADGTLHFVSDRTGWLNLYRLRRDYAEPLAHMPAEFGEAQWELGYSTYAFNSRGQIVARYRRGGFDNLALIDLPRASFEEIAQPYTSIKPYIGASGGRTVVIGSDPQTMPQVAIIDTEQDTVTVVAADELPVDPAYLSVPEAIQFPSGSDHAFALYYPPTSPDAIAPPGERPPLIVQPHPGPTTDAKPRLDLQVQFFTSRGFGVAAINYRGSTGYGRAYRELLAGRWGVFDAEDCANAAHYLVKAGRADPQRIVISGASAGGFTALRALATQRIFRAAVSAFGIMDLEAFRQRAPRFQAHELDRLVGNSRESLARSRELSPVNLTGRISRPVLLIQGLKDRIVPPDQAQMMVSALERDKVPHAYLELPHESHGFRTPDGIRAALEAELYFYLYALRMPMANPTSAIPPVLRGMHSRLG